MLREKMSQPKRSTIARTAWTRIETLNDVEKTIVAFIDAHRGMEHDIPVAESMSEV